MQRERVTDLARATGLGRRLSRPITRRTFLAGAAGAGATLMAGGLTGIGSRLVSAAPPWTNPEDAPWFEKSIPELQR